MTPETSADLRFHLVPSLQDAIRQMVPLGAYLRLRVRLRGNTLHLLCETTCPTEKEDITQAILQEIQRQSPTVELLQPSPKVGIYRLIVYGRLRQEKKSLWLSLINLEQLEQPQVAPLHLKLKNQARLGKPGAIAQYLSQNLSPLGVGLRVETQTLTQSDGQPPKQRLWITCECDYNPDYRLLTEPLVQRLRELQIKGFRDGAIRCQIRGEAKPEWVLWVDLTPPEVMLRQWGRWGDPEAIAILLSQAFKSDQITFQANADYPVLTLVCYVYPDCSLGQAQVRETVREILAGLTPQGLHTVIFQGKSASFHELLWETTWSLPGKEQPEYQDSPETLAQQGNLSALKFLLQRCLNPQLSERLATGGVHITLRQKASTLYVMAEAIACPPQKETLKAIAQLFHRLETHPFNALKIYGRRSGQGKALWQQGLKCNPITPARPATSIPTPQEPLAPEITLPAPPLQPLERFHQIGISLLKTSQLWQSKADGSSIVLRCDHSQVSGLTLAPQRLRLAWGWALLGMLLTAQIDWLAGQWLQWDLAQVTKLAEKQTDPATRSEVLDAQLTYTSQQTTAPKAIAFPENSPYPSFDNPLLNEKLALYQRRIEKNGVPDVLIIGSSRALRGLDPLTLQTTLISQGYPPLDIFNFGINGATVQVFDLLLRQILPPEQLPKLIILADGARAFNSGRLDLTYEMMTRSPGFQALEAGTLTQLLQNEAPTKSRAIAFKPDDLDQVATQWFGQFSQVHGRRQLLKTRFLTQAIPSLGQPTHATNTVAASENSETGAISFNLDGFLALERRFIPETYYQNHPRVTGDYDGDYADFNLNGRQQETFTQLLDHLQTHQVHLVFLNQPLTDHYLDPVRSMYEQQFREYFQQLTRRDNLDFVDLVHQQPWQRRYDFFSDPSHLNQFGAAQVARDLAQISTIPWPR
ncbi:MAG: hypothetical protein VKJ86_06000 [Synechococcus sp.]|nr:hypothetical protein [Synechococcus sp.]